ncbi:hypothetical protein BG006_003651 [Podila minutissima]|uniref:Uncharacterized protein n=1 Tax=Podila minutissima TaxID=64525 RepID=A0A9P5S896_9FUNG|nr:hypothetical protein BG006_003651 [Podila minutissima]
MAMCMSRAAWKERTYIKTIGNCTLMCDRIIHMDGAETLSPEEESEAWGNIRPIHVDIKASKLVMFSFEDAYWNEFAAAHGSNVEQTENVKVIKEAAAAAFAGACPNKKAAESDDVTKEE